jgi:SAM-dependent methyltransferase
LPFEEAEFAEILCRDILEHVDYVPLMKELHRVLKPGGRLQIRVPHFTSENNYADPTHRNFFSVRTFEFFVEGAKLRQDHVFDYRFERVASVRLTFAKGLLLFNHAVEPLLNLSRKFLYLYEGTFLSRLFPGENVVVELVK